MFELYLCQCCVLATANGDTSGCENDCDNGHSERLADYPSGEIVVPETMDDPHWVGFPKPCYGCGEDIHELTHTAEIVTL